MQELEKRLPYCFLVAIHSDPVHLWPEPLMVSFTTLERLFIITGSLFLEFCSYKNICGFLNLDQNPCDTSC